jgi:exopolysaccharide biosynthesis polyprenyl glycosylphosphotransferase
MTFHARPLSFLNLASSTTLSPTDRTVAPPSIESSAADDDERFNPVSVDAPKRSFDDPGSSSTLASEDQVLSTRLFVIDLVAVLTGWVALGFALSNAPDAWGRLAPGVAAAMVTLIAMRSVGLYRVYLFSRRVDEFRRIVLSGLWGAAAFVLVQHHLKSLGPQVLVCGGTYIAVLVISRWQFARWLRAQRAQGRRLRGVVLVGSNEDALQLATMLRSEPELGYVVTGVIGDGIDIATWGTLPASPSISSIPQLAKATGATGVLIVPYALSSASTQNAVAIAAGTNLHVQVWPGWPGIGSQRLRQTPLSDEPFFYIEPRTTSRWQFSVKRILDVTGAICGLILASPIIGAAALLIKLDDRGPVIHRGERVGLHGETFFTYKLRSMTQNEGLTPPDFGTLNERVDGPLFKASNDPRVTKIGRILRASSIDELPQLFNVLQGSMSLVGPRPALPSEVAQFDGEHQRRHSVRPGVTGLWQVEARQNPSFYAYRRLDLRYVDNWSLWLDLTILASTVPAVASQALGGLRRARRH